MSRVKENAQKIIDNLPEEAGWDDLLYEIYVAQKVDKGLKAISEGKTVSHDDVKKGFLNQ